MASPLVWPGRDDLGAMARLAVPIVVVQVGFRLMGVVDTMIVGHLSAEALAAVALGNLFVFGVTSFGFGLLMGLDPVVSQAVGAGEHRLVVRAVQRGLVLSVLVCVPIGLVLLPGEAVLSALGQPDEIVPLAAGYAHRSIPGIPPFLAFMALRQTLQALERLRSIVVVVVAANVANLVLDWIMVYGLGPLPAFGALGSAWATTASRWMLLLLLLLVARADLEPLLSRVDPLVLRARPLFELARLGAPVGVQMQLEIVAFAVIALLMGAMGTVPIAAHQVAISLASLTFMVPVGVAQAAAVRVGHAVGRRDDDGARRAASAALVWGGGFMTLATAVFLAFPRPLASTYTSSLDVLALAAALIPVAGFFQIFDGFQAVSAGILRGVGDTRVPMLAAVLGFWFVGMPVSLYLGYPAGFGPVGLWWGFVAGLGAVALFLLGRVARLLSRPLERVVVE